MKLRYLANVRLPTEKAHGIQIMAMCQAFAHAGAEVELVIPERANALREDPFIYYGLTPSFTIRRLPVLDLMPYEQWLGAWAYRLQKWSFSRAALRDARERPADVYYHRDDLVYAKFCQAQLPSVWEAHDVPRRTLAAIKKSKGKIISITKGLAQALIDAGIDASRLLIAPDGVDVHRFSSSPSREEARQQLGWDAQAFIALYTGHLYPWKGVDTIMEAAKGLPKHVQIKIVGGGPRLPELQARVRENATSVAFLGHRKHEDIPLFLAAADVVLIPTSGKEEIGRAYTSPLKLFEAMAAGRAIMASDLPSLREILNEKNAALVPADDARAWHDALVALASDPEKRRVLADKARSQVAEYDWDARAVRILAFCRG